MICNVWYEKNRTLLQGKAYIPLNKNGTAQAQALVDRIYSKTVNIVYSRPLSRAYDTAQAIADVPLRALSWDENDKSKSRGHNKGIPK